MARLCLAVLALCAVVAAVAAHGPSPSKEGPPAPLKPNGPPHPHKRDVHDKKPLAEHKRPQGRHTRGAAPLAPAPAPQGQQPTLVKGHDSHIPQLKHLQPAHAHFSFLSKVKAALHKAAACLKQQAGPFVATVKQAAQKLADQVKPLIHDAEGQIAAAGKAQAGKFLNQLKAAISAHTGAQQQGAPAQAQAARPKREAPIPQGKNPAQKQPKEVRPKRGVVAPVPNAPGPVVPAGHPHVTLINKIQNALHQAKAYIANKAAPAVQAIKAKIQEAKKCLKPLVADTKNQISAVLKAQASKLVSKLNQAVEKHQSSHGPKQA